MYVAGVYTIRMTMIQRFQFGKNNLIAKIVCKI